MGNDATNYLPKEANKQKIESFLVLLGYAKRGSWYTFFKDEDYRYLYGVVANISQNDNETCVWTRTPIYCSDDDLRYQNYTIKKIRERFGGYFVSDNGKNRYFIEEVRKTTPSERGCYAAHFRLDDEIRKLIFLITNYNEDENIAKALKEFGHASPLSLLSNISTTYISSIIESYFRQMYVAILKYVDENKKESIIKSCKLNSHDLLDVSNGKSCIEQAVALSKSFQNINKINTYFSELDSEIKIKGALSKPYRNRKESLYQTLDRVLEHRHALVHRMMVDIDYGKDDILKDIKSIEIALDKAYYHICDVYNWQHD